MKKSLIITGATLAICGATLSASLIPTWEQVAFATETASAAPADRFTTFANDANFNAKYPEAARLFKLANDTIKNYPEGDKWSIMTTVVDAATSRTYYYRGKGAISSLANQETDPIAEALTAAGQKPEDMTMVEKFAAAKKIDKYSSDASFKNLIDECDAEVKMMIDDQLFGFTEGDTTYPSQAPAAVKTDALKSKTYAEIAEAILALPEYVNYESLLADRFYMMQHYELDGESVTAESMAQYTDSLKKALTAAGVNVSPADNKVETQKSELQKAVDEIKKTDEYKKAKTLIDAVRYLEGLLEMANGGGGKGGKSVSAAPAPKADQPYVAYAMLARQANARIAASDLDPTLEKEIIEAIKAVGDAMRALGISTDLGKNLTTIRLSEAEAAFNQVKESPKVKAYSELIVAVEEAEAAIASGATDAAALKKALEAVKAAAKKVLAPNTGVAAPAESDAAIHTVRVLALTATALTTAGTAFVLRRHLARKAKNNK